METLLLQLSWFLLALSIILSTTVMMTMILRKKRPAVAMLTSWVSLAWSCIAIVSVILTTGYISMRMNVADSDEVPCAAFGLKTSPHLTHSMAHQHPKVNGSGASMLWMVFTDNFPHAEKWARWIAVGLCAGAAVSIAIILNVIASHRERRQTRRNKKANIDLVNKLINKSRPADFKMKEHQISFICKDAFVGTKPCVAKPKVSICYVWAAYASLGVFCAALIGVILLSHYVDLKKEEAMRTNCVSFDYVPLAHTSREGANHSKAKDEQKFLPPFHIISREEWMAKPPRDTRPLKRPVDHVVVSHQASGSCSSLMDCILAIRRIQEYNMGPIDALWDIAGNFLVARDGRVYEGRGWNTVADNTGLYENGSLTILFTGTTLRQLPEMQQRKAFQNLIEEGLRMGNIAKDHSIVVDPKSKKSLLSKLLK